jgi:hypothetical protein
MFAGWLLLERRCQTILCESTQATLPLCKPLVQLDKCILTRQENRFRMRLTQSWPTEA